MRREKWAYSIEELIEGGVEKRTSLFKAIKDGRLKARKSGRRTVVLHEDLLRVRRLPM